MHPNAKPDPKGTITMTYGELQCFASAVMAIARMAEQPGSGSVIGLFGCSTFLKVREEAEAPQPCAAC